MSSVDTLLVLRHSLYGFFTLFALTSAMLPVLRQLGLNDEVIAQKLQLLLADVQSVKSS